MYVYVCMYVLARVCVCVCVRLSYPFLIANMNFLICSILIRVKQLTLYVMLFSYKSDSQSSTASNFMNSNYIFCHIHKKIEVNIRCQKLLITMLLKIKCRGCELSKCQSFRSPCICRKSLPVSVRPT